MTSPTGIGGKILITILTITTTTMMGIPMPFQTLINPIVLLTQGTFINESRHDDRCAQIENRDANELTLNKSNAPGTIYWLTTTVSLNKWLTTALQSSTHSDSRILVGCNQHTVHSEHCSPVTTVLSTKQHGFYGRRNGRNK